MSGRLSQARADEIQQNPFRPLIDKTTYESYFPGSTFKPISALSALQDDILTTTERVECGGYYELGRRKDAGDVTPHQVSMAKRNNVEVGLETARVVRDMLGANGISLEYQTGRHMLNLESVITYEGTHDIHTLAIGEALTGLSAYR